MCTVVGGLPKIVADGAEHHNRQRRPAEVAVSASGLVDHHQRVRPNVAFWMPLRVLRAVIERDHLREQLLDHPQLASQGEAQRRPLGHQEQLLDLSPDPLRRQIVERNRPADAGAVGLECHLEAGRELERAKHSQRVVAEPVAIDHAQDPALEIGPASPRVQVLAGQRIPGDGVDREVTPARRLVDGHPRIALDDEALVAAAALRLAAGQSDVDGAQLEDRKGLPDRLDPPERAEDERQLVLRHAEDLEIQVLRGAAQQAIPHESADGQGATALSPDVFGDPGGVLDEIERGRHGIGSDYTEGESRGLRGLHGFRILR